MSLASISAYLHKQITFNPFLILQSYLSVDILLIFINSSAYKLPFTFHKRVKNKLGSISAQVHLRAWSQNTVKKCKNFFGHRNLSPLHFYNRAREEPWNNTHGVYKQKTGWFKSFLETGYEEKALHPPFPSGESKLGGGMGKSRL